MLLNVLQERVFRRLGSNRDIHSQFRLVAATNTPKKDLLRTGKLREDFYHRIAHLCIELPPLRERKEDIEQLADQFIQDISTREKLRVQGLSEQALGQLLKHPWPGNIRELQAKVESSAFRADFHQRRLIEPEDLRFSKDTGSTLPHGLTFREQVQKYELELIHNALSKFDNNQSRAAESLGLDRSTLRRILMRD